jgi:hypothetical protein
MIVDYLKRAHAWMCDPEHRARSWFGHAAMVLAIAYGFGVGVAVFCYSFREAEQALEKKLAGKPQDAEDNIMDVAVPLLIALPIAFVLGWA